MRLLAPFLLLIGLASAQSTSFRITPAVITRCNAAGLGSATISWSHPVSAPVQVRVLSPTGAAMTGLEPPQNSEPTGNWVSNGMLFVLVDAAGNELARSEAHVNCSGPLLGSNDYLPLQLGNVWVYQISSRFITSSYLAWRVTAVEVIDGVTWYPISAGNSAESGPPSPTDMRVRLDSAGRIFRRTLSSSGQVQEQLWLDPTATPDPSALLTITSRGPFSGPIGDFTDAVNYTLQGGLELETGSWVRGLGFARSSSDMETGSSGGFLQSYELVYAKLGGQLIFATPTQSLALSAESTTLDVTNHRVTNCAVPCYFAACGITPGADPAGTYKPCFAISLRIVDGRLSDSTHAAQVILDLLDSTGHAVIHQPQSLNPASLVPETTLARQIPLYSAPNVPLPPGDYRLNATVQFDPSIDSGTVSLAIHIE